MMGEQKVELVALVFGRAISILQPDQFRGLNQKYRKVLEKSILKMFEVFVCFENLTIFLGIFPSFFLMKNTKTEIFDFSGELL